MSRYWEVELDGVAHVVAADYRSFPHAGAGRIFVDGWLVASWGPSILGHPASVAFEVAGRSVALRRTGRARAEFDLDVGGLRYEPAGAAGIDPAALRVRAHGCPVPLPQPLDRLWRVLMVAGFRVDRAEWAARHFGNVIVVFEAPRLRIFFVRDRGRWEIQAQPRSPSDVLGSSLGRARPVRNVVWWHGLIEPDVAWPEPSIEEQAAFVEEHLDELPEAAPDW